MIIFITEWHHKPVAVYSATEPEKLAKTMRPPLDELLWLIERKLPS